MSVTVGHKISDFTANSTGGEIRLSELAGNKVVLFFYPKDNTPGCTNESSDFRDRFNDFGAAGATVLGVSRDSLKSHENFRARFDFPFHLISDANEALCSQFGVIDAQEHCRPGSSNDEQRNEGKPAIAGAGVLADDADLGRRHGALGVAKHPLHGYRATDIDCPRQRMDRGQQCIQGRSPPWREAGRLR